jgi:hypothetical protein
MKRGAVILRDHYRTVAKCTGYLHTGAVHIHDQLPSAMRTVKNNVTLRDLYSGSFDLVTGG